MRVQGRNPYDVTLKCGDSETFICYPQQGYVALCRPQSLIRSLAHLSSYRSFIIDYLNQPRVREAIGVEPSFGNFSLVSEKVKWTFFNGGDAWFLNQLYVAELLERGIRVLIYAGTHDMAGNWVGNERWTLEMEWSGQKAYASKPLEEWAVDNSPAGKTRTHGNFTFATIYGAGHLVRGILIA